MPSKQQNCTFIVISLISPSEVQSPTSLAIGSFDGLHEGHRKLIKYVVEDQEYTPTIASFWPHPREILYQETRLRLDLPDEKLPLLENLGIKQLVLIPFNKNFSKLSAHEFVTNILLDQLQAKSISVGANFKFGYRRSGDVNTINSLIKNTKTKLNIIPILNDSNGRISSSRVRNLLKNSQIDLANQLLQRAYTFSGKVIKGKGLGKKLKCPTANLQIDGRKFLPGEGVYAAWAKIEKTNLRYPSVMNLGPQPTIDPLSPSAVEIHLIDKAINLYDLTLNIEPIRKIRSQIKFSDTSSLANQIQKDINTAKQIMKSVN